MNKYTTLAAVLTMAAMGTPVVCQAQDPAAVYGQIQKLQAAGKTADAIALCDKVLDVYGKPSSRVAKQFAHMVPFFYWQKGALKVAAGDYDGAYEAYNTLYTNEDFRNQKTIELSKQIPGQPQGYTPFLSASLFQMGYCRFLQAAGKDDAPGDVSKFDEAIPLLEQYLESYTSGKVSAMEKSQKLDGKICFLLLQSYLLKKNPDFQKAEEYLEKSRRAKATLPDDMAINGLNTVIRVATEHPEYIGWGHRVISSSPGSYDLGPVRVARYGAQFLNHGIKATQLVDAALRKGDMETADAAARTAYSLFGLVPDVVETRLALNANRKAFGSFPTVLVDKATGVRHNPSDQKKLLEMYNKFYKDNMQLEAYATISSANMALQMGSNRLAKAGYQILIDRYPKLSQKGKDGTVTSMRDKNYFQFAQLCRATGDDEKATEYEGKVDGSKMGEGGQNTILVNTMARLLKEQKWAEVIPAAEAVKSAFSSDKNNQNYVIAQFSLVAAYYKLQKYDQVIKAGTELLDSGSLVPGSLKEKQVKTYKSQAMFFVLDSYKQLAAVDAANLDKTLEYVSLFVKEFPSLDIKDNPLIANVYYDGIDALLKRRGHGDPAADAKDLARALEYCNVIAENWKENDLYPTARLLTGSILINGEDEARRPEGIIALEECADAALKQEEGKGKSVAANALFWLASYSRDMPREGEDAAAHEARVQSYIDRFWKEADYEGDPYSLQMAPLALNRVKDNGDKAAFEQEVKHAQEIIAREANYAFAANTLNPELEMTINSYAESYVDGYKKFNNKDMTLEEKTAHFNNFPGIAKEDKYTNAILRMAMLNSMTQAQVQAKRDGDTETANKLERDIAQTFRQMTDAFKPGDLTNYICVQVGNYEVSYADRLPDQASKNAEIQTALAYFEMVISRQKDMVNEALLGKANALSLTGDKARQQEAVDIYKKLASNSSNEVVAPALAGITKLYMAMGDYAAAIDSASKYVANRGNRQNRLGMMMMLAQAYAESGDVNKALETYMNLYNQNRGSISYSAPACKAMMELMWKRNKPASGDRLKGTFKQSDHWRAWTTGQDYVTQVRKAGIEPKMTPAERDAFNEVVKLLAQYAADPGVQKEDKEKKAFQSQLGK